jgi:hypothetical protein
MDVVFANIYWRAELPDIVQKAGPQQYISLVVGDCVQQVRNVGFGPPEDKPGVRCDLTTVDLAQIVPVGIYLS